jgi:hypothetical protein
MAGGAALATTGVGIGVGIAAASTFEIYLAVAAASSIGGPILIACATGILTIGLGIFGGWRLFKKGKKMMKGPSIKEKLNGII